MMPPDLQDKPAPTRRAADRTSTKLRGAQPLQLFCRCSSLDGRLAARVRRFPRRRTVARSRSTPT